MLGGAGQSNYSASNVCLDALAVSKRTVGQAGVSVQWGGWAEMGMAARGAALKRMKAIAMASGFGLSAPCSRVTATVTITVTVAEFKRTHDTSDSDLPKVAPDSNTVSGS